MCTVYTVHLAQVCSLYSICTLVQCTVLNAACNTVSTFLTQPRYSQIICNGPIVLNQTVIRCGPPGSPLTGLLKNGGVESLLKYTVYLRIKYVQLYLTVYFKFQRHIFQRIQEKTTLVFSLLCVIMENNFIY